MHLGMLTVFAVKIGGVIPRAGPNLLAVSGIVAMPVIKGMCGSFPCLCTDNIVLMIVMSFPLLALWAPTMTVTSVF
jgi:TRAP-type C4-dicarboxylate transport system permease large subunit